MLEGPQAPSVGRRFALLGSAGSGVSLKPSADWQLRMMGSGDVRSADPCCHPAIPPRTLGAWKATLSCPLHVPRAHSSSDLSRAGVTAPGREQWPLSMSPGSHSPPTGPGPAAQDTQGADPCARQLSSTEDASPVPAQDPTRPLLLPMMGVWLRSTLLTQPGTARGSGLEPASIKTG